MITKLNVTQIGDKNENSTVYGPQISVFKNKSIKSLLYNNLNIYNHDNNTVQTSQYQCGFYKRQ